jgi:TetR/AcrR family transcriptional regulator, transcriptional repressor for nem operon
MKDAANAILDAAEKRIRIGGFGGFSFREIAADVGIKSSSVHYHFPTKEDLGAAVARRYTEQTAELIEKQIAAGAQPIEVWTNAFRATSRAGDRMCPCIALGVASRDLPPKVADEVRKFFKMCLEKMIKGGLTPQRATEVLAHISGALVVANALDDIGAYDRAISELLKGAGIKRARRVAMGNGRQRASARR